MKKYFMMMVAITALTACNGNKFHIDGNIEGASDTTLVLEQSSNGEWYIIEINSRWSGMTTLVTASQGRLPYDVYVEQETGSPVNYSDAKNLSFSCQFKMADADDVLLEKIAAEEKITSVISYEVVRPNIPKFRFNDCVISGFGSMTEMAEYLCYLQKQYPDQILSETSEALLKEVSK